MTKKTQKSKKDLMAMALEATVDNITKSRGGSGRKTYLDRFVETLLDENGNPTEPKTRTQVVAEISLEIAIEQREADIADGLDVEEFTLTAEGDTKDDEIFATLNKRVKAQVASAVANNNNSTSISYNPKYKDVWKVKKDGHFISLAPVTKEDLDQSKEQETEEE